MDGIEDCEACWECYYGRDVSIYLANLVYREHVYGELVRGMYQL